MAKARSLVALSASLALLAAALLPAGCSSSGGGGGGCTKDTDCKGDRVCAQGQCVELPQKATSDQPAGPTRADPSPSPQPTAAQPQPQPGALAADGLPSEIPPPGSPPPTMDEWNSVTREVTVKGSSRLNCETKMLREWVRATCRKNTKGDPVEVSHGQQSGQQAFKFVGNGLASVVVQVVRAKTYTAKFVWDRGGARSGAELTVRWAPGAPRPELFFTEN